MKRVLAATDGSEGSGRAVDFAADLARRTGAALLIVNVIGGYGLPDEVFKRFTRSQAEWLDELLKAHSAQILTAAKDRAVKLGAGHVEIESLSGDVVGALARLADERSAEALVVGRHGGGGVAQLLLGSVAHKLVSTSRQPVIVVP